MLRQTWPSNVRALPSISICLPASASVEAPLLEATPPAGLSAQAIREARAAFDDFTASVGNQANGHRDGWAHKAAAARLEAYVRAVYGQGECGREFRPGRRGDEVG